MWIPAFNLFAGTFCGCVWVVWPSEIALLNRTNEALMYLNLLLALTHFVRPL